MAQLGESSASATAAAAADNHSGVVTGMPHQLATDRPSAAAGATSGAGHKDHVVIDIDSTDSDNVPCCVVCMEPLEWVAVGRCGHRVVCSLCAARIRCARWPGHLRCVICRTRCPTVLVTKSSSSLSAAATAAADGLIAFSKMPPTSAPSQDGRAGDYWYFAAMAAYFDDEQQYNEATKAAAARLKPPPAYFADDDGGAPGGDGWDWSLLVDLFLAAASGASLAVVFTMGATAWPVAVGIVSLSAFLSVQIQGALNWFISRQQADGRVQ